MSDISNEDIVEEIRLTNRLLAQLLIKDKISKAERITLLGNCGVSPSKIADLLSEKPNIVTATLSNVKKAEAKKQKAKSK